MRSFAEVISLALGLVVSPIRLFRRNVRHGALPVLTGRRIRLSFKGEVTIGARFRVSTNVLGTALTVEPGALLQIGDRVFINQGVRLHASDRVSIGSRVEIADLVAIYDTNFHAVEPNGEVKSRPVMIGDDCWIGAGAIILPGVELGRGCVVGAGAVVTTSFPDGCLIAGNPARLVRRFAIPSDYARR